MKPYILSLFLTLLLIGLTYGVVWVVVNMDTKYWVVAGIIFVFVLLWSAVHSMVTEKEEGPKEDK